MAPGWMHLRHPLVIDDVCGAGSTSRFLADNPFITEPCPCHGRDGSQQPPKNPWKYPSKTPDIQKRGKFQESRPEAAEAELPFHRRPPLRLSKMAKTCRPSVALAFPCGPAMSLCQTGLGVSLKRRPLHLFDYIDLPSPDVHLFETNTWSHVESAPSFWPEVF